MTPGQIVSKKQTKLFTEMIKLFNQMLEVKEGNMMKVKTLKLEIFKQVLPAGTYAINECFDAGYRGEA